MDALVTNFINIGQKAKVAFCGASAQLPGQCYVLLQLIRQLELNFFNLKYKYPTNKIYLKKMFVISYEMTNSLNYCDISTVAHI